MKKHYEEEVIANYVGNRQYGVTALEVLVTENEKGEETRTTVRSVRSPYLFTEPTFFRALFQGRTISESYEQELMEVEEYFKLCDFDKINIHHISDALNQAAKVEGRSLPQF